MRRLIISVFIVISLVSCNERRETNLSNKIEANKEVALIKIEDSINLINYSIEGRSKLSIDTSKVIVLDFWATWCGPCIAAFPHLEKLQEKYKEKLQVLAITDEPIETIKRFQSIKNYNLPFYSNENRTLFEKLKITALPTTVLLSQESKLLWIGNSKNLDEILDNYFKHNTIPDKYQQFELPSASKKSFKNNVLQYSIAESTEESIFEAQPPKYNGLPVRMKYINTSVSEVVADLMNTTNTRFINNRIELDTVFIDLNVLSKSIKITSVEFIPKVLSDIQLLYDFKIHDKKEYKEVFELYITNNKLLKKSIEVIEGGGFVKIDNGKIIVTRLSIENLAEYFEKKSNLPFVTDVKGSNAKYNLTLNENVLDDMGKLKNQLLEYGIGLTKKKELVKYVQID